MSTIKRKDIPAEERSNLRISPLLSMHGAKLNLLGSENMTQVEPLLRKMQDAVGISELWRMAKELKNLLTGEKFDVEKIQPLLQSPAGGGVFMNNDGLGECEKDAKVLIANMRTSANDPRELLSLTEELDSLLGQTYAKRNDERMYKFEESMFG